MPHLDLTDGQTAALTQELHDIVESDRYPLSPRIRKGASLRSSDPPASPCRRRRCMRRREQRLPGDDALAGSVAMTASPFSTRSNVPIC
jgi:hypothetical protein